MAVLVLGTLLAWGYLLEPAWQGERILGESNHFWAWMLSLSGVMGLLTGWAFQSFKAAWLLWGISVLTLALTLALLGVGLGRDFLYPEATWSDSGVDAALLTLSFWVLWMLGLSNGIHLTLTWLREMARGQYHFEALATAMRLNWGPIVLSNLTTSLGFALAAYANPQLEGLAWMIGVGALVSLWVLLSVYPWLGLRLRLAFRVGETQDREGGLWMLKFLQQWPRLARSARWGAWLATAGVLGVLGTVQFAPWGWLEVWLMLGFSGLLLWGYWHTWRLAWAVISVLAMVMVWCLAWVIGLQTWAPHWFVLTDPVSLLILLPFGLLLDDAIHYYTRVRRAQNLGIYPHPQQWHRYALSSVGRGIWMTTWVSIVGWLLLAFWTGQALYSVAWISLSGLLMMAFVLLVWHPARAIADKT